MRILTVLLLTLTTLTTLPAFAKWDACPTTCTPPSGVLTNLSPLPIFSTAKWGSEIKMSGNPMWAWIKVAPISCTPAQLKDDGYAFVCAAPIGGVMMRTVRIKQATKRSLTRAEAGSAATTIDPEAPFTRGTIRHCPMRLPDSSYTAEEREQCRVLDVLNGEMRGPD